MIGYNGITGLRNDGIDPLTNKVDLNAAVGALITVRVATVPAGQGAKATLYDINDAPIANPVTTDDKGNYFFKIDSGVYDVISQEGTGDVVVEPAQSIGATAELINNLSQAYEFTTLDGEVDSAVNADFLVAGKVCHVAEYTSGNKGEGEWLAVASAVTTNSYIKDTATDGIQLVLQAGNYMDIRAFGGDDQAADNSTVMNDAFNHPDVVVITGKEGVTYDYTSDVSATRSSIVFSNVHFHGVDAETTLNGTLTELGQLTAGGLKGTRDISFGTSVGVSRGDLLIIHNQVDFSFSQHRANYQDGEYNRISKISGSTLSMSDLLDGVGDYPVAATTKIFKLDGISVCIKNSKFTSFTSTGSNVYALTINYGEKIILEDAEVEGRGSVAGALSINKCHDVKINGGRYFNDSTSTGLQYGIAIGNSDTVSIRDIDGYATRHAVSTGGDALSGAVPNNKINIYTSKLGNDGSIYAADFHGNTKNSYYHNCQISNDIGLAGQDVGAIGNTIISNRANPPIELHEVVGGKIKIHSNKVIMGASSTANKIVGVGSSSIAAQIDRGYIIDIDGIDCELNASKTQILGLFNSAAGTVSNSWYINDVTITGDDSGLTAIISAAIVNTAGHGVAPKRPDFVRLEKLNYNLGGSLDYMDITTGSFAGTNCTMPPTTSTVTQLEVAAAGWYSTIGGSGGQLVFNYPNYPAIPHADVIHRGWGAGNVPQFTARIQSMSATQMQAYVSTADSSITTAPQRAFQVQAKVTFDNVIL